MKKSICIFIAALSFLCPLRIKAVGTSAKAAILINGDTGEVIFEQNADERLPMASTTKIMTALLLCENGDMEREITVTPEMVRVEGSSMGLMAGDKVTMHDLLYGMLLASGNDAANVTAYALGGTVDGFVKMMNKKAEELGLENTNFETPSGLDGDEHYTTARDLASLSRYAMQNEIFCEAAGSKSAVLHYGNPPYRRTLTNHNKLLKTFEGAVGVKTGFTKKSGRCLVSAAKQDGKFVIAVTLRDPDDWEDHKNLLRYGLEQIKSVNITPENAEFTIPVIATEKSSITVSVEPYTVNSLKDDGFSYKISLPSFVYAPIKKGEVVGKVTYYNDGQLFAEKSLTASCDVELQVQKTDCLESVKRNLKSIFLNIWES